MRTLVLMRGSPGSGKSTWIKENNLQDYTISADELRLRCGGLKYNASGNKIISQSANKKVWKMLYEILEQRMKAGAFTIVDATHSTEKELKEYRELAKKYRYRIFVIDMTDIPIEECKKRNKSREQFRQVPEEVVDKFYVRFKSEKVPRDYKVIKPEEFWNVMKYEPIDLSEYQKVHIIGDIHGSKTVLMQYLSDQLNKSKQLTILEESIKDFAGYDTTGMHSLYELDDSGLINLSEFYIFCGDYTDRGIENAEVLEFLQKIYKLPNVVLIEGNHEKWVYKWLKEEEIQGNIFNNKTKPQLDKAFGEGKLNKKKLRDMYRRMCQCFYFKYNNSTVLCTHGGITDVNAFDLLFVNADQMINGVGKYEEYEQVAQTFEYNTDTNVYQVNGHRNVDNLPVQVGNRCFNLEGAVEEGGCLRAITLNENGFETHEVKNDVWDKPVKMTEDNVLEVLRANRNIKEKKFGNISSFNFTTKAFRKGVWDEQTCKARGLFLNNETGEVVCRGYEKFFNDSQEAKTPNEMSEKLAYPVCTYEKYNGFLGLLSYDKIEDDFRFCTKSVMYQGKGNKEETYVSIFKDIFDKTDCNKDVIKNFLKIGYTMLFEVIDPERDPHIVEYEKRQIVLLDIVNNTLNFEKISYVNLTSVAKICKLNVKKRYNIINNEENYLMFHDMVTNSDSAFPIISNKEGYVIEDRNGYTFKLKTYWYNKWKWARNIIDSINRYGRYCSYDKLPEDMKEIHDWYLENKKRFKGKNIIDIRKKFNKNKIK